MFIEGPVKVDACYQAIPEEFCFIGLTGTWNTKDRRDENGIWAEGNDTRLLPELKSIPMRGRKVIILFDSDIEDNISVDDAATDIGNWTRKRGARPHRCTLPSEPNGSKNGADDFVVRHGAKAMKDLPLYTIIALLYGPIVSLAKLHLDHNQQLTEERIDQASEACWDAVSYKSES